MATQRPSQGTPHPVKRSHDSPVTPPPKPDHVSWRSSTFVDTVLRAASGLTSPIAVQLQAGISPIRLDPATASDQDLRVDAQFEALFRCRPPSSSWERHCFAIILPTGAGKTAIYGLAGRLQDVLYPRPASSRTVLFVVVPFTALVVGTLLVCVAFFFFFFFFFGCF